MTEAQYRARRAILRNAEEFTVAGTPHQGIFTIISPGSARRFLDDAAIEAAGRPLWLIVVPDTDTTEEADDIDWDSMTLTVLKVVRRLLRGDLLYKALIAHVAP